MGDFRETRVFVDAIQKAQTPAAICNVLIAFTQRFGLHTVCAGTLPPRGAAPGDQVGHLVLSSWPQEWIDRYVSRGYIFHDPIVKHVRESGNAVLWRDILNDVEETRQTSKMMSEARGFKLVDGIAMSFPTLEGSQIIMSFGGEEAELSKKDLGVVSFAATCAVAHALGLRGADRYGDLDMLEKECLQLAARGRSHCEISERLCIDHDEVTHHIEQAKRKLGPGHTLYRLGEAPRLTPREKECLEWAAFGKSEWEVSQILGISEHTAEKHLLNAKTKLGAANRVHAVAEAIRCGVFD
ncbi:autoinducer binding domain-containing protein [Nitratireductor aquimarinus]|nr:MULTISPECIES: autoinducer binding domain-containing protein [Nitratireductor]MCV0351439.1 autoinducer binding domain-containing protein [Nitratireductor sp.]MBN7775665.1 autoinducer binding domain-containing protein [Nitratireductor pacificus]MBN7781870.1 autoinducer binding domain-containing protein [Nitratireductor pacificus]MBN7790676.1 autoinducer binding domain-containing protein [Nitratireductor aquimarinus]MBN8243133.1 autoinducer binding domain-containing protein [Nitratireductor aq